MNDDLISRQAVLRCIKESRENIDWGQSEDGDAFLHYSAALYRTIASEECLPSAQSEPIKISVDHAMTEEELKELKQKVANLPVVLLPSEQSELKKGKWILCCDDALYWNCSCCGELSDYKYRFCPYCGADMRGDKE